MINLNALKRQHNEIGELVISIKKYMGTDKVEKDAALIANNINLLAGKLKIHLNTEDQFMYPNLLKDTSEEKRRLAKSYMDEMGDISSEFVDYKNKFNTKTKILASIDEFISETKRVFRVLEARIEKEDKFLYSVI